MLSSPGGLVMDPFSGSGTTAVEAQRLGRRSFCVDVSPISCLITRAKTLSLNAHQIADLVAGLKRSAVSSVVSREGGEVPPTVQCDKWYSAPTLSTLSSIFSSLKQEVGVSRDIGLACFSAVLLPSCNEDRHWGYVCDNTHPKAERNVDVLKLYKDNLDLFVSAYQSRDEMFIRRSGAVHPSDSVVIQGDITKFENQIDDIDTVDCIITSPPYFGVADYVKSQRLTLEWLGEEIEPLRKTEIGARSKRHRTNARIEYIKEITEAFRIASRPLKESGYCLIVYGESSSRQSCLPEIVDGLHSVGLKQVAVVERSVSISRRQKPSVLVEHIILTQKSTHEDAR